MSLNKLCLLGVFGLLLSACQYSETEDEPAAQAEVVASKEKATTRSQNVMIDSESFEFPDGQVRDVWIYLPPGYATSDTRYPVLYMHDGQNVFDSATSYVGEWEVDESLNQLADKGWQVPIVVAINHGNEARVNELSPWHHEKYPDVVGKAYAEFIVNQVKPEIDAQYRTLSGVSDTSVMGSSLGGLISHYMLVAYPDVFGKAAIFSPSFWFSQQAFSFAESHPIPSTHRLLFIAGSEEGEQMSNDMNSMVSLHLAQQHPQTNLYATTVLGGKHNEAFWKEQFAFAVKWLEIVRQNND
ncbi:alpha/beta hydrolase [Alteromonas ponticola]|uniref:Alpha/beta hydrolase n=1 Tax=Alteromonas ponticola TaxID=2720613 RepID=A0ABX1QW88_9ALTE|nr:alpha/beta hydrolase-fold protein [Alteromonas ponticola]NMH58515.1 alpha/beta hydrolase [Alteromonas ponticola]